MKTETNLNSTELDISFPFENTGYPLTTTTLEFFSVYMVAMFLKCQRCASCCRPESPRWTNGVRLLNKDALALKHQCRITKKNGQYLMKAPCQLLKRRLCTVYDIRPFDCRSFPIILEKNKTDDGYCALISHSCPATSELVINITTFLQLTEAFLLTLDRVNNDYLSFADLEKIKINLEFNSLGPADINYLKEMAGVSLFYPENKDRISIEEERRLERLKSNYLEFIDYESKKCSSALNLGKDECQRCGFCCSFMTCVPRPDEIAPIAEFLGLSTSSFVEKYLVVDKFLETNYLLRIIKEGQEDITTKLYPEERWFDRGFCVFYDKVDKQCKIHPVRPQDARDWKCWDCETNHKHDLGACGTWGINDIYQFIPNFKPVS